MGFEIVSLLNPTVINISGGFVGSITGNTDGTPAVVSSGTMYLAGGNNVTLSQDGNTISINGGAGGGGGGSINLSAGTTSRNLTNFVMSNSNGLSFGLSGSTITGSYTVPTQTVQTQNLHNISLSGNTAGVVAQVSSGTLTLAGGNNVTLSQNGNAVTISGPNTVAQTQFVLSNSNGISFGTNGSTVTATVRTDYQSSGAYLTTARASNDAIGLNTAVSNATITANSSGLSFDGRGYAGTGTTGTNATFTLNSNGLQLNAGAYLTTAMQSNASTQFVQANAAFAGTNASGTIASSGISISVAAGGGAGDGYNIIGVNGAGTQLSTTLQLSNSNNITFGLNAGTITASASYSTLPIATNVNDIGSAGSTGTAQSYAPADHVHAGVVRIAAGSTLGNTLGDTLAKHGNWVIAGTNGVTISGSTGGASNTMYISVNTNYQSQGAYLTTARASNDAVGLNTAQSNVTWTANSSGLSIDARGYAGTNTATTGSISVTLNSSGISLNAPAFLTTAMASNRGTDFVQATAAFNGTNASGTIASNGISISVAPPGAAVEQNNMSLLGNVVGNSTASGSTIGLIGGNGVTLSGTNGSQIRFDINTTPDAWSIVGNTAGASNTYAWTNNSLYLSGGNNITLSQNGSTLAIVGAAGGAAGSDYFYEPYPLMNGNSTTYAPGLGTWHFQALKLPVNLASGRMNMLVSMGSTSAMLAASNGANFASNTTGGASWSFRLDRTVAIYSRGAGGNSTRLESVWSNTLTNGISQSVGVSVTNASQLTVARSVSLQYVQKVETDGNYTTAGLGATHNASYASSVTVSNVHTSAISSIYNILSGAMLVPFGFNTTLSAGDYWLGIAYSTASTTAGTSVAGASIWPQINQGGLYIMSSMSHRQFGATASSTGSQFIPGHGAIYSAVSAVPPPTIPFSDLRSVASHAIPYVNFIQSVAS